MSVPRVPQPYPEKCARYDTVGCVVDHAACDRHPCRPSDDPAWGRTRGVVSGPMNAIEILNHDRDVWKARAEKAEAKVTDLAAHIRRLEEEPSAEAFAKWLDSFVGTGLIPGIAHQFAIVIRRGVWFKKPERSGAV